MAQSLTSLSLVQQLSAKVGSATGIQSSIPVGGTNATTLSSSDADIIHAFKIQFQDSSDVVRWTFATGAVLQTAGGTDVIITGAGQGAAGASFDAAGVAIPSLAKIVAIYYEIPATNGAAITATASSNAYGIVTLSGAGSVQRSALLVPQGVTAGAYVDFSTTGVGSLDVVYCNNFC
mgnify:CR=1 FL=1